MQHLLQKYSNAPVCWRDIGSSKHNPSSPIGRTIPLETVWVHNWRTPEWVKKDLQRPALTIIPEASFQSGTFRGGHTVQKKLLELTEVQEIHAYLMESGNALQVFEENHIMDMYMRFGSIADARHVFDNMPRHDVVSWNVMILGYAKHKQGALALELYARMHQEGVDPSNRTFVAALKACSSLAGLKEGTQVDGQVEKSRCLEKGRSIHIQAIKGGFELDLFVGTTLLDVYAKCESMEDAQHVFDKLPHHDVVSWTPMILGYAQKEEGALALELFAQMDQEGAQPNNQTFVAALKACSSLAAQIEGKQVDQSFGKIRCLEKGRAIHSQLVKSGLEPNLFVGTSLVDMYAKCGSMEDAHNVLDEMPHRPVVSWTALILGHAQREEGALALQLYEKMHQEGVTPIHQSFIGALKACSSLTVQEEGTQVDGKCEKFSCLETGRAIHVQVMKSSFESDIFIGTLLLDMYAKCGSMDDARHVFEQLPYRDVVAWTAMIMGYAQKEEGVLALELYACMHQEGVIPNNRTFISALKACSSVVALEKGSPADSKMVKIQCLVKGREIHSQAVQRKSESDVFLETALIDMYAKCGSMEDAQHLFDEMPHHDVVSWTAMILEYAQKEEGGLALELFAQMRQDNVEPNHRTFVAAFKACSSLASLEEGKQVDGNCMKIGCLEKGRTIHSQAVKRGFDSDAFVGTTLVGMYGKCGCMQDAQHVFDKMLHCNTISWTAMISGYAEQEESEKVLQLNAQMQKQGRVANTVTFISILRACGNTAALEIGKELHSQICRVGLETSEIVSTSLIDMYAKCGSMIDAHQLFHTLLNRDFVAWNALIAGYAHHGESEVVFYLLERMRQEGIQPNGGTLLSVLIVCSHGGLVDKGQDYFWAMPEQYDVIPTIEHYTCLIDLLGRAGKVEEAVATIEEMPCQPDVVLWVAVLGACRKWKNVELGRYAFERAIKLDGKRAAAYVLMSNIYAQAHMWEDRAKIGAMRKKAGAWKKPGKSWWTDFDGRVHTFTVGDRQHPQSKDIYAKLKEIYFEIKEKGYVPDLNCVLWDMSDDEKEEALCGHSEKLAIACALINTPKGTAIRVVKNLRFCDDCHKATAFISKIEQRDILCRDASRFHHFKDGSCSCKDYW